MKGIISITEQLLGLGWCFNIGLSVIFPAVTVKNKRISFLSWEKGKKKACHI